MAEQTGWIIDFESFGTPAGFFCLGATLAVYNLDRLSPFSLEDAGQETVHRQWVRRHVSLLWAMVGLGGVSMLAALCYFSWPALLFVLLSGFVPLAYIVPSLPWTYDNRTVGFRRLKQIPGLKTVSVAFGWTVATVWIPWMFHAASFLQLDFVYTSLRRFAFIYALTVPFEIKDRAGDIEAGVRTIATILGPRNARLLALTVLACGAVTAWLQFGIASWRILAAYLFSFGGAGILIAGAHDQRSDWYYFLGLDGMIVLQGLLVLTASL